MGAEFDDSQISLWTSKAFQSRYNLKTKRCIKSIMHSKTSEQLCDINLTLVHAKEGRSAKDAKW